MAVAGDAGLVADGLAQRLAQSAMPTSSTVWWSSMCRSPAAVHGQVQQAVTGDMGEHVVEEADAGDDLAAAVAVERDGQRDVGLGGASFKAVPVVSWCHVPPLYQTGGGLSLGRPPRRGLSPASGRGVEDLSVRGKRQRTVLSPSLSFPVPLSRLRGRGGPSRGWGPALSALQTQPRQIPSQVGAGRGQFLLPGVLLRRQQAADLRLLLVQLADVAPVQVGFVV